MGTPPTDTKTCMSMEAQYSYMIITVMKLPNPSIESALFHIPGHNNVLVCQNDQPSVFTPWLIRAYNIQNVRQLRIVRERNARLQNEILSQKG